MCRHDRIRAGSARSDGMMPSDRDAAGQARARGSLAGWGEPVGPHPDKPRVCPAPTITARHRTGSSAPARRGWDGHRATGVLTLRRACLGARISRETLRSPSSCITVSGGSCG
jgi:hypothetical protein